MVPIFAIVTIPWLVVSAIFAAGLGAGIAGTITAAIVWVKYFDKGGVV